MRPPLEYGDNFPVPAGSWDPRVPWRFPNREGRARSSTPWAFLLPWIMLGVGLTLGVLWMNWRELYSSPGKGTAPALEEYPSGPQGSAQTPGPTRTAKPKSRLV
ncbi:MAG: hypothetical protein HYZ90_02495 [Candidatus Omnitrophica bacterium]|nr:hypothetical protein [Candidatus Omnitrophota bacterium]